MKALQGSYESLISEEVYVFVYVLGVWGKIAGMDWRKVRAREREGDHDWFLFECSVLTDIYLYNCFCVFALLGVRDGAELFVVQLISVDCWQRYHSWDVAMKPWKWRACIEKLWWPHRGITPNVSVGQLISLRLVGIPWFLIRDF